MNLRIATVGHVDHGKSTLIGRLMAETDQVMIDRQDRVRTLCQSKGRKFEYAFLLDALEEEQSQGITIDVTEVQLRFQDRIYTFVDTPGHREFIKKMVGGASKVDVAVILIDAVEGLTDSFYRQMKVLDILGIQQRIILINKMDLADWSESRFKSLRAELSQSLPENLIRLFVLPVSAWHGENLFRNSSKMMWYIGPTFIEALAQISPVKQVDPPTRFFIQDVYRKSEKRILVGRMESGSIEVGDRIAFFPGDTQSTVLSVEKHGESRGRAEQGEAIGLTISDSLFLDRGHIGYHPSASPLKAQTVDGELFWLDSNPVQIGDRLKVKMGPRQAFACIESINQDIDSTFVRARFRFEEPWAYDPFDECSAMARFVVSVDGRVVGGGRWSTQSVEDTTVSSASKGMVLWLTGLSGAGKSTLALGLREKLGSVANKVLILDGDELRRGLCQDLGFSAEDRTENIRRSAEVAKWAADSGLIIIAAFISPLSEQRETAKSIIGADRFFEVFVDCPLNICELRDVKGFYAKAREGLIENFTGIDSEFEIPERPDLHLKTADSSVEDCLKKLFAFTYQLITRNSKMRNL